MTAGGNVLGAAIGNGDGKYQPADPSLTANGMPSLRMQMGDGTSETYNPAADPEVQAKAQRLLAMNLVASNDVTDPSLSRTATDDGTSTSVRPRRRRACERHVLRALASRRLASNGNCIVDS